MIYLPYSSFTESSLALDPFTVASQVTDICKLLDYLHEDQQPQYINTRLVSAWKGHEPQLCQLGLLCVERIASSHGLDMLVARLEWHLDMATSGEFSMDKPEWVGDERIHLSHQNHLYQVDPEFYSKFAPSRIPVQLIWP